MFSSFHLSERETTIADAQSSLGKTLVQRIEMFRDLLAVIEAIWRHLPREEQLRRLEAGYQLDPRPDPWWANLRREAWPDNECNS